MSQCHEYVACIHTQTQSGTQYLPYNSFQEVITTTIIIIIIIIIIINCTHTMESANVKVQNIFHEWNNIRCSTDCKYRTAATPYNLPLKHGLFQVYNCKYPA